jgi:hypothetical protein
MGGGAVLKNLMKTSLLLLSVITPSVLLAQDFVAPQGRQLDIAREAPELSPEVDGIVKQIFDVKKPWQLLNPAAPASLGTGEQNVSKDTVTGTAHHAVTLTVVGVEW